MSHWKPTNRLAWARCADPTEVTALVQEWTKISGEGVIAKEWRLIQSIDVELAADQIAGAVGDVCQVIVPEV